MCSTLVTVLEFLHVLWKRNFGYNSWLVFLRVLEVFCHTQLKDVMQEKTPQGGAFHKGLSFITVGHNQTYVMLALAAGGS